MGFVPQKSQNWLYLPSLFSGYSYLMEHETMVNMTQSMGEGSGVQQITEVDERFYLTPMQERRSFLSRKRGSRERGCENTTDERTRLFGVMYYAESV